MKEIISESILAGIFISVGGAAFLTVGGITGAILFTFGLASIVCYQLYLFTGLSGFIDNIRQLWELFLVLVFNIVGCLFASYAMSVSLPDLGNSAIDIVSKRVDMGALNVFILAIFCGFIMTTVVTFARKKQWIPLLLGIPLFIMCGFVHSIADAFYYGLAMFSGYEMKWCNALMYLMAVVGNFVGCNLYRVILFKL